MVLGLLRINLWVSLVLAMGRSLLQLMMLAIGLSIALEFPGWGTIVFLPLLAIVATQFTGNRLELPVDRYTVGGILCMAAGLPTLYAVVLVLQPTPVYAPQAWIPVFSLSLASASAMVLQGGNGVWQQFQRQKAEEQERSGESVSEDSWMEEVDSEAVEEENSPEPSAVSRTDRLEIDRPETDRLEIDRPETEHSTSLMTLWRGVLTQVLSLRLQQITALGLVSLPLVFAAQLLVNIDPLVALGYEVLLMLTTLNSALIALWGLQRIYSGLAKPETMRRRIPRV